MSELGSSSLWNSEYIDSMTYMIGKYNRLEDEVNELKRKMNFQLSEHKNILSAIEQHSRQRCFVNFHGTYIGIYNYQPFSVRNLIGKHGNVIKRIENLYKIFVKIPNVSKHPNEPIKVFPMENYCDALILFNGISSIINILDSN